MPRSLSKWYASLGRQVSLAGMVVCRKSVLSQRASIGKAGSESEPYLGLGHKFCS